MSTTATLADATWPNLPGLYRGCRLTGDGREDATGRYADPDLLGHGWVGPDALAPGAVALVVHDEAGVAGYCVGAPDTAAFEQWLGERWFPPLQQRYPLAEATPENQWLVERSHVWPPTDPALLAAYPARLHAAGARGIHLGVNPTNAAAIAFDERLRFRLVRRSSQAPIYGAWLGPQGLVPTTDGASPPPAGAALP